MAISRLDLDKTKLRIIAADYHIGTVDYLTLRNSMKNLHDSLTITILDGKGFRVRQMYLRGPLKVFYENSLIFNGYLELIQGDLSEKLTLGGRSVFCDFAFNTLTGKEFENKTDNQLIRIAFDSWEGDFDLDEAVKIKEVTIGVGETRLSFAQKIAQQTNHYLWESEGTIHKKKITKEGTPISNLFYKVSMQQANIVDARFFVDVQGVCSKVKGYTNVAKRGVVYQAQRERDVDLTVKMFYRFKNTNINIDREHGLSIPEKNNTLAEGRMDKWAGECEAREVLELKIDGWKYFPLNSIINVQIPIKGIAGDFVIFQRDFTYQQGTLLTDLKTTPMGRKRIP